MSNFEVCEEMQKLRNYLDEHKIKWRDKSDKGVYARKDNVDFLFIGCAGQSSI